MAEVTKRDQRVRYFRQPKNIGWHNNFKFVLGQATGEFFMWAADDDEWNRQFIERCLANMGSAASVVSGCDILFRTTGHRDVVALPTLNLSLGTYLNLRMFLRDLAPGFIYGVHRRESLHWVLSESPFDWWDCYFVARQIAEGGIVTFQDVLFTMGIDADSYVLKPFDPGKGRLFRYRPFLQKVGTLIIYSSKLSFPQKLVLLNVTANYMADAFIRFESKARPRQVKLVRTLCSLKRILIRLGRKALKRI